MKIIFFCIWELEENISRPQPFLVPNHNLLVITHTPIFSSISHKLSDKYCVKLARAAEIIYNQYKRAKGRYEPILYIYV